MTNREPQTKPEKEKNLPLILGVLSLSVIVLLTIIFLPGYLISIKEIAENSASGLENEFRKIILQTIAGIFVLWGLTIANQRAKAHEEQLRQSQGLLIAQRFSIAIEQLGKSDNLPSVLGGVYTLDHIAEESDNIRFQVMKVLTAYVRVKSPTKYNVFGFDTGGVPVTLEILVEMQDIMTVIGSSPWVRDKKVGKIDLSNSNLAQMDLHGAYLRGADLSGAWLLKTNLREADLSEADLSGAHLRRADRRTERRTDHRTERRAEVPIAGLILDGPNLEGTNLSGVKGLTPYQLEGATLDKRTILPDYLEVTWLSDTEWEIKERPKPADQD